MSFAIKADVRDMERLVAGLRYVPQGLETAVMRAINKTIEGARTDAVAMIRRDYNLKAGYIRQELRIRRATKDRLEAALHGAGRPGLPLINFDVLPRRVPSTRRNQGRYTPAVGISAMVKKGERTTFPGYFVARMASGHVGVFRRDPRQKEKYSDEFTAAALARELEVGATRTARELNMSVYTLRSWVRRRSSYGSEKKHPANRHIKQAYGPSVIKLLHGDRYDMELEDKMEERWEKNLRREANHVMRQFGLIR